MRFADEKVCIGPPPARQSYLYVPAIISAAEVTGADAVHPGYGFLAENADFAEVVQKCGLHWIGPQPEVMRPDGRQGLGARGDGRRRGCRSCRARASSRATTQAEEAVERIGLPVIIKASAGGGGRGMKIVEEQDAPHRAAARGAQPRRRPGSATRVYIERYIAQPAPHRGAGARRRQPATSRSASASARSSAATRSWSRRRRRWRWTTSGARELLGVARKATEAHRLQDGRHARVPARRGQELLLHGDEHPHPGRAHRDRGGLRHRSRARADPAGRRASRCKLAADIRPRGHAIEVRINAEDPVTFAPSPGRITGAQPAGRAGRAGRHPHLRQYVVPPNYDSLLAKLIVHAENRPAALARLRRALAEFVVEGTKTNIDFHRRLIEQPGLHRRPAGYAPGREDVDLGRPGAHQEGQASRRRSEVP